MSDIVKVDSEIELETVSEPEPEQSLVPVQEEPESNYDLLGEMLAKSPAFQNYVAKRAFMKPNIIPVKVKP